VQGRFLKSRHNIEWPAWDNAKLCERLTGGPDAVALADKAGDAWIALAHTGIPNKPKMPRLLAYTVKTGDNGD
jgi:hypothetical protein